MSPTPQRFTSPSYHERNACQDAAVGEAGIPEPSPSAWHSRGDFGFESVDTVGLLGDAHVGVEQLADELDEELSGVGEAGHGMAPFREGW
jgi:hypothetical protein